MCVATHLFFLFFFFFLTQVLGSKNLLAVCQSLLLPEEGLLIFLY